MNCPSAESLLDYLRDAVSAGERAEIGEHLSSGCPVCLEQRQWLASVLEVTAQDRSYDLPAAALARVVNWFRGEPSPQMRSVRRFVAQMIFDSLRPSEMAPMRSGLAGAGAAAGRQILYRAEGYDIDLRFESGEDSSDEDLIGQILPEDRSPTASDNLSVRLVRDQIEVAAALANARGVFKFAGLPSGIYDLRINVPEGEILINQVATARAV